MDRGRKVPKRGGQSLRSIDAKCRFWLNGVKRDLQPLDRPLRRVR